jgi:glyceraldehyde 3-phosphate dehydrogenase
MAFRVPTTDVSAVDLKWLFLRRDYIVLKKCFRNNNERYSRIHRRFSSFSRFCGDSRTSIIKTLMDIDSTFQKIISWYDNEYGYSSKLIDLSVYIAGLK